MENNGTSAEGRMIDIEAVLEVAERAEEVIHN